MLITRFIHRARRLLLALLAVVVLGLLMTSSARASVQTVELSWSSIDSGGASFVSNGIYSLGYTIGQADYSSLTAGSTQLKEGFWGGVAPNYPAFMPLVRKP